MFVISESGKEAKSESIFNYFPNVGTCSYSLIPQPVEWISYYAAVGNYSVLSELAPD